MLTGKRIGLFVAIPFLAIFAGGCRSQTESAPNDLDTQFDPSSEPDNTRVDDATEASNRSTASEPTEESSPTEEEQEETPAPAEEAPDGGAQKPPPAEPPAPPVDKITATVDGKTLKSEKLIVMGETVVNGVKGTNLYVYFSGAGLEANTRFAIRVTKVTKGCAGPQQYIQYQPADGTFNTYFTDGTSICPLTVGAVPTATTDRVKLSFVGTMKTSVAPVKTRTINLKLDVLVPAKK